MTNTELEALVEQAQAKRDLYEDIEPSELDWTPEGALAITFSDGHKAELSPAFLRSVCPCAECRGTHGTPPKAFNILSAGKLINLADQTVIKSVQPAGHYGLIITWGDGHDDGIYTWAYLRGLAEHQPSD